VTNLNRRLAELGEGTKAPAAWQFLVRLAKVEHTLQHAPMDVAELAQFDVLRTAATRAQRVSQQPGRRGIDTFELRAVQYDCA